MQITIYLSSELDGLLFYNGVLFTSLLAYHKEQKLNLEANKNHLFTFYPIENQKYKAYKLLPYTIKLQSEKGKIYSSSEFVKLINYNNDIYDLVFLPNLIYYKSNNNDIKKLFSTDNSIQLEINPYNTLIFEYNNQQSIFAFNYDIQDYVLQNHNINQNKYVFLSGYIDKYEYLGVFFIDNNKISKLGEFLADKIEINKEMISVLKKEKDMAKHAIITTYKLQKNQIIKTERYLTSLKQMNKIENSSIIPFAFLEAVKVKNYDLARCYLSETTSKLLSNKHLANYFGNFCDIKPSHSKNKNIIALIYKDNNSYFAKHYCFSLLDNKIDNIDEIKI